jgi:O-antigen ligase
MRTVAFILLWLYVFTLPWDYILQFGDPFGSAGRVFGLLALAGYIVLVATTARMRRLQIFHIAAAAYLAIVAASLLWTADPDESAHYVRVYVQSVMVVLILWELGASQRSLFHLATAYVAGAFVAALSIFHNLSLATVALGAKEARFAADNWDVNDIALVLSLAIPLAFYLASKRIHWTSTWLARGYLIAGPIAIVLTSSRSGMVVMAIAFSALPLFLWRQTAGTKVTTGIVLACAACLAWNYAPQQSWDRLSTLFASLRAGDLNGRELVWQNGLLGFSNNYLGGVGAGEFRAGLGSSLNAHNTFLEVLVEQGLVGFGVFSLLLGCAMRSVKHTKGEERKMCVLLFLCWSIGAFTLGWATNRVTWFVLGVVVSFGGAREQQPLPDSESAYGVPTLAATAL